jgi:glyoxylate reductase
VTNTPSDVVNQSVAEFTLALIMSLIKGLPAAADFAHNVGYKGWEPDVFLGKNAKDKVLGVIGAGRIGGMVATMASAVGFGVMTFSRNSGTRLEEVLAKSDVVTLHVPLTPETKHMINARTMEQMKAGAYLVNTARGPVVDEADLVAALKSGRLAGAALDVWENEPSPRPELVEMENVILTPHVASATIEARKAMGEVAVANLLAGLTGQVPPNLVKE